MPYMKYRLEAIPNPDSAKELHKLSGAPPDIILKKRTIQERNLPGFLEYFKEIKFERCIFKKIEQARNQNSVSAEQKILTEKITVEPINGENVINLLALLNLSTGAIFKLLKFDRYLSEKNLNDLWITAIHDVPVEFVVEEIFITVCREQEEIIFWLIIVEKLIRNLRRCSIKFQDPFQLDILIRADDERLKAIGEKLGDNFLIIDR